MDLENLKLNDEQKASLNKLFEEEKNKAQEEFKKQKADLNAKNENLLKEFKQIAQNFGLNDTENLSQNIEKALKNKNGAEEIKLKSLEEKIANLTKTLENEKKEKLNAIKKTELNKIIDDIENLNADHKEIVEIKLNNAFKIDDAGNCYFENDGVKKDNKEFLEEFFKQNEKYILPKGVSGSGIKNDTIIPTNKKFSEYSEAELIAIYKKSPEKYREIKNRG